MSKNLFGFEIDSIQQEGCLHIYGSISPGRKFGPLNVIFLSHFQAFVRPEFWSFFFFFNKKLKNQPPRGQGGGQLFQKKS